MTIDQVDDKCGLHGEEDVLAIVPVVRMHGVERNPDPAYIYVPTGGARGLLCQDDCLSRTCCLNMATVTVHLDGQN